MRRFSSALCKSCMQPSPASVRLPTRKRSRDERESFDSAEGEGGGDPAAQKEGERCRNMAVQLRESVRLVVGPSKVAGWGAFPVKRCAMVE